MSCVKIKEFKIRDGNEFFSYKTLEDVPKNFDNLIKWDVTIPPDPHTKAQHEEIEESRKWFKDLLKREKM